MVETESWLWRTVNNDTGEARRFYGDGAALVATGTPAPKGFWQAHPLVQSVREVETGAGEVSVRIFLAVLDAPEAPDTAKPDRPADLRFSGEWKTDVGFWAAHPWVEHLEARQLVGDEPDGDCWTVALWLKAI